MSKKKYTYRTVNGKKERLHRMILEEHLGRPLEYNEHVYFLNGDTKDNRIENLVIIKKNILKCRKKR